MLEIGSFKGRSTIAMARTASLVVAVDCHEGDKDVGAAWTLPEFATNVRDYGLSSKVIAVVGRSEEIGPYLRGPFDLVFIDGSHHDLAVEHDTNLAVRLTTTGGVIVWHDWDMPSVRNGAARALDGEPGWTIEGTKLHIWER